MICISHFKENFISGAALDVLPTEPPDIKHSLIKDYMKSVSWLRGRFTLTPHAAYYSPPGLIDLRTKAVKTAVDYIENGRIKKLSKLKFLNR